MRPSFTQSSLPAVEMAANATNQWTLQATLSNAVIHDISFPTSQVGYAAAELGQVWKTTDGGNHWTEIMNIGAPYYWYGVQAFSENEVVISGFIDVSTTQEGVIRWSEDGGASWTPDIIVNSNAWAGRIRFGSSQQGLTMFPWGYFSGPNFGIGFAEYTNDGGVTASDWTAVTPDTTGAWFNPQFSLLPDLHTAASGINYCDSANGGVSWACRHSIDSVFDGPVFFANDMAGWVGGGEIAPNVEGWVHLTTDGGATWSARTLDGPWPIREIWFVTPQIGWAAGGNIYSGVGGIFFTHDGGETWNVDVTTGSEMDACDSKSLNSDAVQIWCAGYNNSAGFNGVVYTTTILTSKNDSTALSSSMNPATTGQSVNFTASVTSDDAPIPQGQVTFLDGGNSIGSGALDASGAVVFSDSSLATGAHLISASYSGDAGHSPSTSNVVTQVVNKSTDSPTTTSLSVTMTPTAPGEMPNVVTALQTIILTATVSPSPRSSGSVIFADGANILGAAPVSGGVAEFSTQLTVGQHSIQVAYSGGGGFQGSFSAVTRIQRSTRPR